MDVKVVPDDNITLAQSWNQLGFQIGFKCLCIDRSINHPRRNQTVTSQRGDEGLSVPFAKGRIGNQSLALDTAPTLGRHIGFDAGLINEQNPTGGCLDSRQADRLPNYAFKVDISACALGGQKRFFYS